ncbi:MAG: M56 family metallopeptidase [Bacteroidales bacterium]|nr:M56 family metallopeptidase [Bacteroidales bacterium]
MNDLFIYLLQSGINLAVLYIIYWLFLRKDTFFSANRFYLVLSVIFSFALPLFKITVPIRDTESGYIYLLETIVITPDKLAGSIYKHLDFYQIITIIYLIGVGIFMLRFLYRLVQIGLLISKYGINKKNGFNIVFTNPHLSPFSFFNIVFLSNEISDQKQFEKIITHESIHIRQKHSFDLIILELLTIIQWFNPFIWFYKKTLKNIHEFLADEGVLSEGYNRKDYQQLLLNQTLGIQVNAITNNFNQSLIKRRFTMMSKSKTNKFALLKMLVVIPLALFLVIAFSVTVSNSVIAQDTEIKEVKSEAKVIKTEEGEIFPVVEQMPRFPGGDDARIKFLNENLKYPDEARKQGISGRVFISFVVENDGEITNIKLLRGIGGGCDEEAMRVVSIMPTWEPGLEKGKPVRVQFNMPFKFLLDEKGKKKDVGESSGTVPPPPPKSSEKGAGAKTPPPPPEK